MTAELVPVDGAAPANSGGTTFGRPFQKGKSGNPAGRPKGMAALSQRIRRETKEGKVIVDVLLDRLLHGRGDRSRIEAAALLLAYAYGRPVQPTEVTGAEGGPIEHALTIAAQAIDYRASVRSLAPPEGDEAA